MEQERNLPTKTQTMHVQSHIATGVYLLMSIQDVLLAHLACEVLRNHLAEISLVQDLLLNYFDSNKHAYSLNCSVREPAER
jgi:hypothetical protein